MVVIVEIELIKGLKIYPSQKSLKNIKKNVKGLKSTKVRYLKQSIFLSFKTNSVFFITNSSDWYFLIIIKALLEKKRVQYLHPC